MLQFAFAAAKPGQGNRNAQDFGEFHPHVALHDSHDRKGRQLKRETPACCDAEQDARTGTGSHLHGVPRAKSVACQGRAGGGGR